MAKKEDKRLCWNCDGYVHFYLDKCPYCNCDLTKVETTSKNELEDEKSFAPPYAPTAEFALNENEWKQALKKPEEKEPEGVKKNELAALFLLLPGVVFVLFGLTLIFFSKEGALTLEWNENFAYFYFLGALPLLALGWKSLSR